MKDIDSSFWKQLEEIYTKRPGGKSEWDQEGPILRSIFEAINRELDGWYELVSPINLGGAGVVVKVRDLRIAMAIRDTSVKEETFRALKVPRPIYQREGILIALLNKEASFLASLTHSNVIKLYAFGNVKSSDHDYPYYVMDYIKDAKSPVEHAQLDNTTLEDILRIFSDVLEGFCYFSEMKVTHNDPKPANILVDNKGRAIVSDLGSAKRLDSKEKETIIPFTKYYAPAGKRKLAIGMPATDYDRVRIQIAPKDIPVRWDIFSVGLSFLEILEAYCAKHPQNLRDSKAKYRILYLRLLIGRMLGDDILESQTVLSLPKCFYQQLHYERFEDSKHDLDKLCGKVNLAVLVPELDLNSKNTIQGPMSGPVPWTERVSNILKHPAMRRLMSVTQLGLLSQIYPNATHSRFEHSLGAYGNAVRMINALWEDQQNPLFRLIMNKRDLEACLLTVLLHDLGQYPLAHDLEEAEPDFFGHEELTLEFVNKPLGKRGVPLAAVIDELWGSGAAQQVNRIFTTRANALEASIRDRILHSIVDGPLDADKLDYIARDSSRLQLRYGGILDYERIFRTLTIVHEREGDELLVVVGIHEKGRTGAECVAFARYSLFSAAYWHHTSRAIKSMVHRAVWEIPKRDSAARREFLQVLLDNKLPLVQPTLFEDPKVYEQPTWPGIEPTDLQVLLWIWSNSTAAGKQLIECVIERKLFKRAFVIGGGAQLDLLKKLQKLRRETDAIVRLEKLLAEKIGSHLQNLSLERREETDAFSEATSSSFMDRLKAGEILILVDIPKPELSKLDELRCLPEADRWKPVTEYAKPVTLEDSPVWRSLVESFGESAGKIRVFVHPDFTETVRNLKRDEILGILKASVTEILG